jgi:hypothetical protein
MCAVPSAPGVAGVRVREVMSRGPGPRTGAPPPEGVDVGYPPTRTTMQLSSSVRTGTTSKWFATNPRPNSNPESRNPKPETRIPKPSIKKMLGNSGVVGHP